MSRYSCVIEVFHNYLLHYRNADEFDLQENTELLFIGIAECTPRFTLKPRSEELSYMKYFKEQVNNGKSQHFPSTTEKAASSPHLERRGRVGGVD